MIADKLQGQITDAMKNRDELRVSTLKLLSAALTNAEIAKKREKLTKEEELEVVRFEAKKRKDAIEAFSKANRKEQADKEREELKILQEYLPKDLTDQQLVGIVTTSIEQTKASGMADFGKVMGAVMAQVKGRADGNAVSKIVKEKLGNI